MLRLTLLGSFQLDHGSRASASEALIPYQRARALLAYLVLEPGEHRRDFLASLLWPELPLPQARDALRRMVHILRQALGEARDGLFSSRETLAWRGEIVCDARDLLIAQVVCAQACDAHLHSRCIAASEAVLETYGGPLLAAMELADSPDFLDWLESRRTALHRQVLALRERLLRCCSAIGRHGDALRHARAMQALDPWQEAPLLRLLDLLVAQGNVATARAEYEHFAVTLQRELAVAPSAALRDYVAALDSKPLPPPPIERHTLAVVHARYLPDQTIDVETTLSALTVWAAAVSADLDASGGQVQPLAAAGLTAYFGYPQADEEATRKAVSSALALAGPQVAVGVAAGWALTQVDENDLPDAGGLLASQAVLLACQAPAGEVRASRAVRQRAAGWFSWQDAASDTQRPLAPSAAQLRFASKPWQSSPLVGRTDELAWLHQQWQAIRQQQGVRSILLEADAGVGKSRLAHEFLHACENDCCVVTVVCRPEWSFSPFRPLQEAAEHFGWAVPQQPDADPRQPPDPYAREAQVRAWAELFLAAGGEAAAVLCVEDAHWVDPSTLAVLNAIVTATSPCLLLLTARTGHGLNWPGLAVYRLTPLATGAMLAVSVALAPDLSDSQRQQAVSRAEGVPLFLEALLGDREGAMVPGSLAELLAARLASLGNARGVAECAAILGSQFDPQLLGDLGCAHEGLMAALIRLESAGFTRPDGEAPGHYRFRHGLLRDAVLAGLRQSSRQRLHLAAAAALQTRYPELARQEPERLAGHYQAAGAADEAVTWLTRALACSAARHAYQEAVHHGETALPLLQELPESPLRDARELTLRLQLGMPLAAVHGYGSAPVQETYQRALALAGPLPDVPEFFPLLWGLWLVSSSVSGYDLSLHFAERLVRLAPQCSDDPFAAAHAHYALGNTLLCRGALAAAVQALEKAVALTPPSLPSPYGEDAAVTSLSFLALARWRLGDDAGAGDASQQAVARGRKVRQPQSLAFALILGALLGVLRGDSASVRRQAEEALALAQTHGLALWQTAAATFLAGEQMGDGDAAGWPALQQGLSLARTVMAGVEGFFLIIALSACERSGRRAEWHETALRGLAVADERQDRFFEAGFLHAAALSAASATASAAYLARAEALASAQGFGLPQAV